jgi:hypothetical protein
MPGNSPSNPIFTTGGSVTVASNFYTFSVIEGVGTAASNNYLSLLNPVGSGKTINVDRIVIVPWASGATTTTRSMTITRISAASGGTAVTAANIPKFSTSQPNSIADVRTGNPTVTTVGIPTLGFPPAVTTTGAGASGMTTIIPPSGSAFQLQPGEGIVFNVAVGTTGQLWNLNLAWSEQ